MWEEVALGSLEAFTSTPTQPHANHMSEGEVDSKINDYTSVINKLESSRAF